MALTTQEQRQARNQLAISLQPSTLSEKKTILKFSQVAARLLEDGKVKREPVKRDAITAMFKAGNDRMEVAYNARFEDPVHIDNEAFPALVSVMTANPGLSGSKRAYVNVDATADAIIVDLPFMVPYEFMKNPLVNAVLGAIEGRMHLTALNETRVFVRSDKPK